MYTLVVIVHIIVCIFIVLLVLLQSSDKGADLGSTFGGSSQTLLGANAPNFLAKLTTFFVSVFVVTSILLTFYFSPAKKGIVKIKGIPYEEAKKSKKQNKANNESLKTKSKVRHTSSNRETSNKNK